VGSHPSGRTRKRVWTLALLVIAVLAGGASPANAQSPGAEPSLLDPIVQLVCDLTTLLCPPEPATVEPVQPAPPAEVPANPAADPFAGSPPVTPEPEAPSQPAVLVPLAPAPQPEVPGFIGPVQPVDPAPVSAGPGGSTTGARNPGPAGTVRQSLVLPRPAEVDLSPGTVAAAAAVSLFGLILIGFPAELFNKTLRENYDRIRRLLPGKGSSFSPELSRQVLALVASSAVAGCLAAIQKVNNNWSLNSALTVALAVGLGFLLTTLVYEVAGAVANDRLGMPRRVFRTYPAGLPVVAFFVAVSTIGQLQPAYLYGHLAGSRLEGKHHAGIRGPALQTVASCGALLGFGLLCWALRAVVIASPWTDILAGVTVVALNRLVFSLIPVTFLDGHTVFRFSRGLWAAVYSIAVMAFLLLVILPAAQNAPPSAIGSAVVPFVIFVGLSLGIWAFFRRSAASFTQTA
jgi:hypothetical protein